MRFPTRLACVVLASGLVAATAPVSPVLPSSMKNLDMASDSGGILAFRVGQNYYRQRGVFGLAKADAEQAMAWFMQSAGKGNASAMLMLARMYENGEGVAKDKAQALYWTDKAAQAGHAASQEALARMGLEAPQSRAQESAPVQAKAALGTVEDQVTSLCEQISREMSAANKPSIAVVEFSNLDGQITELGKFLAEEITTALFQTKRFKVIERQMLNKVLREQKLQNSGMIDEESAKKLGKLLGVTAIVSGTVTELSSSVKVNARLIGTETGEIFGAASAGIVKDESIRMMLAKRTGTSEPSVSLRSEGSIASRSSEVAAKPVNQSFTKNGFKFSFISLRRGSEGLVGTLEFVTTVEDKRLTFSRFHSGIVTPGGNQFKPKHVDIGNSSSRSDDSLWYEVFVNVPVRVEYTFVGVPEDVQQIPIFKVSVYGTEVVFRNLTIQ